VTVAVDVLVAVLLVLGAGLNLVAAVGLHRLPDVFCRMHAATKPATFGLITVLIATTLALGDLRAATKLGLVAVLQFATNPVGGHMVSRAAWRAHPPPATTAGEADPS
jgi:multicomponent Na+:H+ antiporter subunit G